MAEIRRRTFRSVHQPQARHAASPSQIAVEIRVRPQFLKVNARLVGRIAEAGQHAGRAGAEFAELAVAGEFAAVHGEAVDRAIGLVERHVANLAAVLEGKGGKIELEAAAGDIDWQPATEGGDIVEKRPGTAVFQAKLGGIEIARALRRIERDLAEGFESDCVGGDASIGGKQGFCLVA